MIRGKRMNIESRGGRDIDHPIDRVSTPAQEDEVRRLVLDQTKFDCKANLPDVAELASERFKNSVAALDAGTYLLGAKCRAFLRRQRRCRARAPQCRLFQNILPAREAFASFNGGPGSTVLPPLPWCARPGVSVYGHDAP